jgi:hypothetical protein
MFFFLSDLSREYDILTRVNSRYFLVFLIESFYFILSFIIDLIEN